MTGGSRTKAAIVSIGNELLFGETVDTNAAWLARHLSNRGIEMTRCFTVGDVKDHIDEALGLALDAADVVILTGGLGPTPDDVTKSVVAAHLGRSLIVDEDVREDVRRRFESAGYDRIPMLSRGQAEIPEGSTTLRNPSGTAPGIVIESEGKHIVLLPGVPQELKDIVEGDLEPHLGAWGGAEGERTHHRTIHTTGLAETSLAERLEPKLKKLPHEVTRGIDVAYLPDVLGVDLRFTIRGGSSDQADRRFDTLLEALDEILGPWRFEADSGDIAEALANELRMRGWTLSVAESCTGGLVGKRMTDHGGASDVFMGGFIAYADEVKVGVVGVSPRDLKEHGAVSETVARQLAAGVARRLGTETGIGVTGIAGPGGGSEEKPVGTVWIATSVDGDARAHRYAFSGDRSGVRDRAAQAALAGLYRRLLDEVPRG